MSSSRQKAIVSRTYKPIPDRCADALKLLLMKPVITEGSPSLAALEDAKVRSKHDSRDTEKYKSR